MIFCKDCKYYRLINFIQYGLVCHGCDNPKNAIFENTPIKINENYGDCNILNKNNDCKNFKRKFSIFNLFK